MRRAEEILERVRGPSVLDVGCTEGEGLAAPGARPPFYLHRALHSRFPEVWGIDINETRLNAMEAAGFDNLHLADAQTFSLGRTFHTIVAGELIEHVENPGLFLSAAKKHLEPDGRLVITTPYPFGIVHLAYALKKFPKTVSNPEHTLWLCPTTMKQLADRVGLSVAESFVMKAPSDLPRSKRGFDLLVKTSRLLPQRISGHTGLYVLTNRP